MSQRIILILLALTTNAMANNNKITNVQEDKSHVQRWNTFASSLYKIHQAYSKQYQIRTRARHGGYHNNPQFYKEIYYYDKKSNRLLSKIQWEVSNPQQIHLIEIYIYDHSGKLVRDYLAAYLPKFRNAPIQTLINLHGYDDELNGFRQFDASGNRIYEQCKGKYFGKHVDISLEEDEIAPLSGPPSTLMYSEAYRACFSEVSISAQPYLNPLNEIKRMQGIKITQAELKTNNQVKRYSAKISREPDNAEHYVKRGNAYFESHDFKQAIKDFTTAIRLNNKQDKAWLGRGMAHGRMGNIEKGIADLSEYIKRNPKSSYAYTKRGVRYIWLGQLNKAESDLRQAIKLNPVNSEAHDDLGVILANRKNYKQAIQHFRLSVKHSPDYQKAYHNLSLVYHLIGQPENALAFSDRSLQLNPKSRNSLMLKSLILKSLGRNQEAGLTQQSAESLPDSNWSETFTIRK